MNYKELYNSIIRYNTFLCVGLDVSNSLLPEHLKNKNNGVLEFNKAIIDATWDYCIAYKPNAAFYESDGVKGIIALEETIAYINQKNKLSEHKHLVVLDAKRGDIGNTAERYAQSAFEHLQADAVTLSPYMGKDTIEPFLKYTDKWSIVLALTSNPGSAHFELQLLANGQKLYEKVILELATEDNVNQLMFVVGATNAGHFAEVRKVCPNHFWLVPGVGAQGGSLQEVFKYGHNSHVGLLINSSRGIIFASSGTDFAEKAAVEAEKLQLEMAELLKELW